MERPGPFTPTFDHFGYPRKLPKLVKRYPPDNDSFKRQKYAQKATKSRIWLL